jgi:hypothetical protein
MNEVVRNTSVIFMAIRSPEMGAIVHIELNCHIIYPLFKSWLKMYVSASG